MYAIRSYYDDYPAIAYPAPTNCHRITSYNVCYTKLLRDFQLDTNAAAIDQGSLELIGSIPELQFDFAGNSRTADGHPDLGAYEFQP